VDRRAWSLILLLAALWGASYMFIKVAIDDVSPIVVVWSRLVLAAIVLLPIAHRRGALTALRPHLPVITFLAVIQVLAPFLLITFGEHVVPSGLTAVLISPASLFIALLAPFILPAESIDRRQGAGMLLGLAGVVVVVGVESVHTLGQFLGALAMIGAAFFYALSNFVVKGRYGTLAAVQTSWISVTVAGVMTLPVGIATTPGHTPDLGSTAALVALGVLGTALAFVIYYKLITEVGAGRAALVSYLAPGVALFYGAIFRDEAITVAAVAGLALSLGGVAIASRPKKVRAPAAQAATASAT